MVPCGPYHKSSGPTVRTWIADPPFLLADTCLTIRDAVGDAIRRWVLLLNVGWSTVGPVQSGSTLSCKLTPPISNDAQSGQSPEPQNHQNHKIIAVICFVFIRSMKSQNRMNLIFF